ncbi:MAG: neutral zinc metallopeptidase [Granulosicoccaceae bacterium]
MRWKRGRRSQNIEDRRGMRPGARGRGARRGGGMKIGGTGAILLLLASLFFGQDLLTAFTGGGSAGGLGGTLSGGSGAGQAAPPLSQNSGVRNNDEAGQFISSILADTEDVWNKLFQQAGKRYQAPKVVLFEEGVNSACGFTSSAAGPFYCPGDSKVYIDLSFFRTLQEQMKAGGDFAQAYVLAHEVGHHIQNQLGVSMAVQNKMRQVPKKQANELSVRAELQADCYAGVWAHHAHKDRQLLEPGDLEEGMNAAARIGDDALMRNAGRRVHPDGFTHGSSQQRQTWLYKGLESGDSQACDTFNSQI